MSKQQLLLLKDVEGLGRAGDLVQNVRPGYKRNFLFPQKLAVLADARALKMREKIQEMRRQQAIVDKQDAEAIAEKLRGAVLSYAVKVDHEGHMYGSVGAGDLVDLIAREYQVSLERKNIALKHPIKVTGVHEIPLKLKEGVSVTFTLKILSEEAYKNLAE